ncbi:MAG: peptide chain release factor N(5)-glutamine methyltransferase [Pseudomonadota bacterium]
MAATVGDEIARGAEQLRAAGLPGAERDARWLMAACLGIPRDRLTLHLRDPLSSEVEFFFPHYINDRLARKPVSRILGERLFWGRLFKVTDATLDPRPETEVLVEIALSEPFGDVLDLGTGTGCILVTLLAERPKAIGVGTDISEQAVLVAGDNAAAHGVASRLILPVSDWWEDVGGTYDLIVSNPPYIAAVEMADLAPEVRKWDPEIALTDEGDGLSAYRAIAGGARDHLTRGGRLLVEIGPSQGAAVAALFQAAGLEDITIHPDMDGRDRVVVARRC